MRLSYYLGALLVAGAAAAAAHAQYPCCQPPRMGPPPMGPMGPMGPMSPNGPYGMPPIPPQGPPTAYYGPAPGFMYGTGHFGTGYGLPPMPFNGMLPQPPWMPPPDAGQGGPPEAEFVSHPYARSPRDFFMYEEPR